MCLGHFFTGAPNGSITETGCHGEILWYACVDLSLFVGLSENSLEDKVVVTIVKFVATKFIPMWIYPTGHVCGKERLPYSFCASDIKLMEPTGWTWHRHYSHGKKRPCGRYSSC